jgi:hypothetical protein
MHLTPNNIIIQVHIVSISKPEDNEAEAEADSCQN